MGYWGTGVWSGDAPCDETSNFIDSIVPIYNDKPIYKVNSSHYTVKHTEETAYRCLRQETLGGAMAVLAAAQALGIDTTGMGELVHKITVFERKQIQTWVADSQNERRAVVSRWRRKILGKAAPYRVKDLPELEDHQRKLLKEQLPAA